MTSHADYFVTPAGRVDPRLHRAALIAVWEHVARVTLVAPLPVLNQRGR